MRKLTDQCLGREQGFTLLEVLTAMVLSVLALVAILAANTVLSKGNTLSHQRVIAVQDAQRVMERVREVATAGRFPANVTNAFPDGGLVPGFNNLRNQQVRVNHTIAGNELLDVSVNVNWQDETNHNLTYSLGALITQRE